MEGLEGRRLKIWIRRVWTLEMVSWLFCAFFFVFYGIGTCIERNANKSESEELKYVPAERYRFTLIS